MAEPTKPITDYIVNRQPIAVYPVNMHGTHTTWNVVMAVIVVLFIIILMYFLWVEKLSYIVMKQPLSKKIAKNGWVLYVEDGCKNCIQQMALIGNPLYSNLVVCSGGKQYYNSFPSVKCSNIPGFPFWYNVNTKESKHGLQSKDMLIKMGS